MNSPDDRELNPYQSPALTREADASADPGTPRPVGKLYSIGSIGLATFLGSPAAGGVVLAINYWRLGRKGAAIQAAVWSSAATAAMLGIFTMLPEDIQVPNMAVALVQLVVMYFVAKSLQEAAIIAHQQAGGTLASAWKAAGIGVLVGIVVGIFFVAVLLAIISLAPDGW